MSAPEFKTGKCAWCGNKGTVYFDNSLCEECDRDTIHCVICNQRRSYDGRCRHVFQDANFEWAGSGAGVSYIPEGVTIAFKALLSAMPLAFAFDIRAAIQANSFHTWLIAPLIGGGGLLELNGIPWQRGRLWGEKMIELGEGEDDESLADGYHWLASLYNDHTPDANRATIGWINDWIAARTPTPARDREGEGTS